MFHKIRAVSSECTLLYLVQRQHEVLLCGDVLQHDGQLSFVLHAGVDAALHLHTHTVCVCVRQRRRTRQGSRRLIRRPYLGLQGVPLLYLGIKLPGVKSQLHLPQEAVVSEAVVVPHGDLQGSGLQLRVADHVLHVTGQKRKNYELAEFTKTCRSLSSVGPLTRRFSLKTGLMVPALMLVFLLLCRDVSGSRYVFT